MHRIIISAQTWTSALPMDFKQWQSSWTPIVHQRHRQGMKFASGKITKLFLVLFLLFLSILHYMITHPASGYSSIFNTNKLYLPVNGAL